MDGENAREELKQGLFLGCRGSLYGQTVLQVSCGQTSQDKPHLHRLLDRRSHVRCLA